MNPEEYRRHYELEETHWWFRARRALTRNVLRQYARGRRFRRILDAGCGTGGNLISLAGLGEVHGCDLSEEALRFCRRRGLSRLARADLGRLPYEAGAFGLVTLFDVLYHKAIGNDVAVLEEVRRVLEPGGLCWITDSALPILFSPHDAAFGARERYTKKSLGGRVLRAGFEIVRISYFYAVPFPAIFLTRQVHRLRDGAWQNPKSDLGPLPAWLNEGLSWITAREAALAGRMDLPVGSSIFCLAVKP
jgi:SAM-dependent methyltransferase